jgi:hypothetical protein
MDSHLWAEIYIYIYIYIYMNIHCIVIHCIVILVNDMQARETLQLTTSLTES